MSLTILGLGTSVPACAISQGRAAELASSMARHSQTAADRLSVIYGLTGITRRHVAMLDDGHLIPDEVSASPEGPSTAWRMKRYEATAGPLALEAASAALDQSGLDPKSITHLVTVSCTGFAAPGFDLGLVRDLDLDPSIERTHVGFMGCHGAMNGLRVARLIGRAEPESRVLLCAAELCSLHFSYGPDAEQDIPTALFADGAAALVGVPRAEASAQPWRVAASGSCVIPGTEDAMTWKIRDHGFEMTLSPQIPALIREYLKPWLTAWLERNGTNLESIGSWAVHPGGPRILDAVRVALGLDKAALADSRAILASHGNMSSPTVLFIIDALMRRDAPRPCVVLGFGPGLAIEAALIR